MEKGEERTEVGKRGAKRGWDRGKGGGWEGVRKWVRGRGGRQLRSAAKVRKIC